MRRLNLPNTNARPVPAAALVQTRSQPIVGMFAQLDVRPKDRPICEVRLVPIVVMDFYSREPADAAA